MNIQSDIKNSNSHSDELIALHRQINTLSVLAKFPQVNPNTSN